MFLQIVDPSTNENIDLFSEAVNKLLDNGYTIEHILMLAKNIPLKYNRENIMSNDMILNYVTHLDLNDIKSLCLIDKSAQKLYNEKYIWKIKINKYIFGKQLYVGEYSFNDCQRVHNAMNKCNITKNI